MKTSTIIGIIGGIIGIGALAAGKIIISKRAEKVVDEIIETNGDEKIEAEFTTETQEEV